MSVRNLIFVLFSFLIIFLLDIGFVEAIAGGQSPLPGQFKFAVSVQANDEHICGGAIIDEEYVLTAAQCVIGLDNSFINKKYSIVGAAINLRSGYPHSIKVPVEVIYVPVEFKFVPNPNNLPIKETGDLAVLKLNFKLFLGDNYVLDKLKLPERLYRTYIKYYDTIPSIIGFGYGAVDRGSTTDRPADLIDRNNNELKFIEATVKHKQYCKSYYPFHFNEKFLCAKTRTELPPSPVSGPCYGDIGDPLVLDGALIGILILFDKECNGYQSVGLYTRMTSFITFTKRVISPTNKISHKQVRVATYRTERGDFGSFLPNANLIELEDADDKINALYGPYNHT